jgi:arylsulfatase A-like enzyme
LTSVFVALLLLCGAAGARGAAAGGDPHHLLETLAAKPKHGFVIAGAYMPVLNPYEAEHVFPLPGEPAYDALMFSVGLKRTAESGTVRFEVLLEDDSGEPAESARTIRAPAAKQEPVSLFRRELSEPGWVDVRVDLPERGQAGRRLVFRKSLVDGSLARFLLSAFGDPVLLPSAIRRRPSIVLLSIDTLRADYLGAYGRKRAHTPALDRLAREGTLYENAYSPSTWTSPAHAALMHGLYPSALARRQSEEANEKPLLAERLRASGYRTAAFTGGGYLAGVFGLEGGFGTYYTFEQPSTATEGCSPERFDGEEVFGRAAKWLAGNADLPFFLFIHTYDAHDRCPVVPAAELSRFRGRWDPGEDGRRAVLSHYEELIAGVDRRVGTLLAEIERLGIADSTLVLVTSDHGEAFWEHGLFGHGCEKKPYRELARVPLILRLPGVVPAGGRIEEPVSLVDVMPTVLGLAGLAAPPTLSGRALPLGAVPAAAAPRPVFVHCADLLAVRSGPYRLLTSRTGAFPDEVYDLENDPGEKKNLAGKDRALDAALRALAAEYWSRAEPDAGGTRLEGIDEKTWERLRALGYLE